MASETQQKQNKGSRSESSHASGLPIKWIALGIGSLLLVIVVGQILVGALASEPKRINANQLGGAPAAITDGYQEASVSMRGNQYLPNPLRLKVGVPTRLTFDLSTVQGCYRNVRIPELGVAARLSEGSNTIEFTPTKAGTFRMTCSMGMGQGVVVVEDQDGQVPGPAPNAALINPSAGSCGAGGGGCGCGG